MEAANKSVELLRQQISATETELKSLRNQLAEAERLQPGLETSKPDEPSRSKRWPLSPEEYVRYGRQMIVPSMGIESQIRIRSASVLIVGAGGLGCPAAAYIAGAGVKTLGLVDGDTVEISNLHRQILHSTDTVGLWKVDSAIQKLKRLNPDVEYKGYREHISPENALDIVSQYDLVLDCTDNPRPRYIISDACVLLQKALISASALQTDGQIMALNSPPRPQGSASGSPCYRCVFPKPPPADSIVSCGEGGILGPVVGTMGVLQALEAIKMIAKGTPLNDSSVSEFDENQLLPLPTMLLFSSSSTNPFRTIRLRSRRPDCFACSAQAGLTKESMTSGSLDYVAFCGVTSPVTLLSSEERISAKEYAQIHDTVGKKHILIDTREKVHFDIANIDGSINIPLSKFHGGPTIDAETLLPPSLPSDTPIYVVCRLGNDSQVVTKKLKESGLDQQGKRYIGDIKGGLKAWKEEVDGSWPEY